MILFQRQQTKEHKINQLVKYKMYLIKKTMINNVSCIGKTWVQALNL